MGSLFQVFAGERNQIWWLLPIHLGVSNFSSCFRNTLSIKKICNFFAKTVGLKLDGYLEKRDHSIFLLGFKKVHSAEFTDIQNFLETKTEGAEVRCLMRLICFCKRR